MTFTYYLNMNLIEIVINSIEKDKVCYERNTFEAHLIVDKEREILPGFITFSQIEKSCTLSVETTSEQNLGTYELEIIETNTNFTATSTTRITLQVKVPEPEKVEEKIETPVIQEEKIEDLATTS